MKAKSIVLALLTTFLMSGMALADKATWLTSWDDAVKQSKERGKPILMDFTGSDWCGWCMKLDKEVFDTETFQKWAKKNVVLLKLDFPNEIEQSPELVAQNQALAQRYGVRGFPTIIFADQDGKPIGKLGYDRGGPEVWTSKATRILER